MDRLPFPTRDDLAEQGQEVWDSITATRGTIVTDDGTLIGYRFDRDDDGRPVLRRTMDRIGPANEGGSKVEHIQAQVGRRPLVGMGNSGGDREMLEWAADHPRGGLAVLVDHDDAAREFAYEGTAVTFADPEPITTVAERLGWLVVSMKDDWGAVFAS